MAPSVILIDEVEKVFVSDKKRAKEFGGQVGGPAADVDLSAAQGDTASSARRRRSARRPWRAPSAPRLPFDASRAPVPRRCGWRAGSPRLTIMHVHVCPVVIHPPTLTPQEPFSRIKKDLIKVGWRLEVQGCG
jgi:hypothetical protein